GGTFLGIKAVEYAQKFHEHHVPGPYFHWDGPDPQHVQLFFSLYFVMTGLHALHMVIGIGILGVLAVMALRGRFGPSYFTPVELTIPFVKASLVLLSFMHLRYSSRLTWLFVGIAFFWLGTMIVLTMTDIVSRGWFGAGLG